VYVVGGTACDRARLERRLAAYRLNLKRVCATLEFLITQLELADLGE
jgi:hypothetical protein